MNPTVEKLQQAFRASGQPVPDMLYNCSDRQAEYNAARQVFNTRFQFMPLVIVYCETSEQIGVVVKFIDRTALPLRVRSGGLGHDHEGECSGTDTVTIDLSKMNRVIVEPGQARIQPGIAFKDLTTQLAEKDVMIPHGTCATVHIAGYTLGGGWGPWTRKHGMCCEHLVEATLVLGDGSIHTVWNESGRKDLLWALKGGGGFSYGIVTEFVIKTFVLPYEMIKFQIEWNPYREAGGPGLFRVTPNTPTLEVLTQWEATIESGADSAGLVGTNLKISAIPHEAGRPFDYKTVYNNCIMYGYWEGDDASLAAFILAHFGPTGGPGQPVVTILGHAGRKHKGAPYGHNLMSNWDRVSLHNVKRRLRGLEGTPFPPDLDAPAPHKITSRLVNPRGLGDAGHAKLLESLCSPLLFPPNYGLGLFTYITLGAITGEYYRQARPDGEGQTSSFPYKDRPFTIQYQTWWNEKKAEKKEGENNPVYNYVNRALDWMEVCRDYDIPNTSGAFISFKDDSVTTRKYFDTSYEDLVKIKRTASADPDNHFHTRKTII